MRNSVGDDGGRGVPKQGVGAQRMVLIRAQDPRNKSISCIGQDSARVLLAQVVVLMFPIVTRMCEASGVPFRAALYTLTMAASASFSTPVSYQTNLMVAKEGGYAFGDFVKFGLPLQLVCAIATVPACYLLYK